MSSRDPSVWDLYSFSVAALFKVEEDYQHRDWYGVIK
jgi:hypothetical protein